MKWKNTRSSGKTLGVAPLDVGVSASAVSANMT